LKNQPEYYYKLNGTTKVHSNNLKLLVNGSSDNLKWSYYNEWSEILRECRPKVKENGVQENVSKDYIFIRCEAEYLDG
jgi:hypothetical protein